ncbi:MAG TPA: hypothetical protein VMF61_13760 [Candidatus Acidoferrales bacterium]|nr:hypothetical protein [Candidatus Acidoferrales bacterium]
MFVALPLLALLLVVAESLGLLSSRTPTAPKWPAPAWIFVAIAAYAVELAAVGYAAHHQLPAPPWETAMPLRVVDDRGARTAHADVLTAIVIALGALQAYALLGLYRADPSRRSIAFGFAVVATLSMLAPAMTSADAYSNVGYALLGDRAYAPPASLFAPPFDTIERWWGVPMVAAPYGPLWLRVAALATSPVPTLLGKIVALRCVGAASFGAAVLLMAALGMPRRLLAAAALNPALAFQWIVNAHNDALAVALAFAAAFFARRNAWLAIAFVAAAALIKLPFAVVALPVLAAIRSQRVRWIGAASAIAAAAALSWLAGGRAYASALVAHAIPVPHDLPTVTAALVAVALCVLALCGGRRLRSAAWTMPCIGGIPFAWYFTWGLPYALTRRRVAGYVLVALPLVSAVSDTAFARPWVSLAVLPVLALLCVGGPRRS